MIFMTKNLMNCPIENTLKLIDRKWTIVLIKDMFSGKKYFREFIEGKEGLSNTVLADTLKFMEQNDLIRKNEREYSLTHKGFRLNRILYEMAVFGLDEIECNDMQDLEVNNMFKDYYAKILRLNDESSSIE